MLSEREGGSTANDDVSDIGSEGRIKAVVGGEFGSSMPAVTSGESCWKSVMLHSLTVSWKGGEADERDAGEAQRSGCLL